MRSLGSALVVLALLTGSGGGDATHEGDGEANRPSTTAAEARPKPLRQVEKVLNRQRASLFSRYDAEGLDIGSEDRRTPRDPEDPVYLIEVYIEDEEARPEGEHAVDGVPIRFVVSGPIEPHSTDG